MANISTPSSVEFKANGVECAYFAHSIDNTTVISVRDNLEYEWRFIGSVIIDHTSKTALLARVESVTYLDYAIFSTLSDSAIAEWICL